MTEPDQGTLAFLSQKQKDKERRLDDAQEKVFHGRRATEYRPTARAGWKAGNTIYVAGLRTRVDVKPGEFPDLPST